MGENNFSKEQEGQQASKERTGSTDEDSTQLEPLLTTIARPPRPLAPRPQHENWAQVSPTFGNPVSSNWISGQGDEKNLLGPSTVPIWQIPQPEPNTMLGSVLSGTAAALLNYGGIQATPNWEIPNPNGNWIHGLLGFQSPNGIHGGGSVLPFTMMASTPTSTGAATGAVNFDCIPQISGSNPNPNWISVPATLGLQDFNGIHGSSILPCPYPMSFMPIPCFGSGTLDFHHHTPLLLPADPSQPNLSSLYSNSNWIPVPTMTPGFQDGTVPYTMVSPAPNLDPANGALHFWSTLSSPIWTIPGSYPNLDWLQASAISGFPVISGSSFPYTAVVTSTTPTATQGSTELVDASITPTASAGPATQIQCANVQWFQMPAPEIASFMDLNAPLVQLPAQKGDVEVEIKIGGTQTYQTGPNPFIFQSSQTIQLPDGNSNAMQAFFGQHGPTPNPNVSINININSDFIYSPPSPCGGCCSGCSDCT